MVDHSKEGIRLIDEFFATEANLSEEDKLRYGLKYGVEHGILTEDEAALCEKAYHDALEAPHTSEET